MSLLEITNLSHSFSENVLYKNADFSLNKGEHIGIVGQNGTGKSTLIKLCTGQLLPDEGRIIWQPKTSIGYLDQYAEIDMQLDMKRFLKTALRENYIRQYSAQQKEIKKTEEFIRKNIAGRKSKMARGRQKQLDRMDKMEAIEQKEVVPFFHFREMPLTNTEHLSVKHLSVGYHYPVLSDIDFAINGGQKVVITGFNGIGKSTLLKTLVGKLDVLNGSFSFSEQVKLRYFEQDLYWENEKETPIQIVSDCYPSLTIKEVRKNLACCGIIGEHAMQSIGTLSGGEQAKVKICLLTLTPCNFIIMDEPTNHLDIQAKQALRIALKEFKGTVLLVSHEPAFYKEIAQKIINIENIIKKK